MLQRFRMTVNECMLEYMNLGGQVFGQPRPYIIRNLQPKFDANILERVIKEVCKRRGEDTKFGDLHYNLRHPTFDGDM